MTVLDGAIAVLDGSVMITSGTPDVERLAVLEVVRTWASPLLSSTSGKV